MAQGQSVRLVSDEARGVLDAASLLRSLDDTAVPQDYIAAARADYQRLLTALYSKGYYGGTISITIDGVEAANIAPLAAPARISEVVINVDPGPQFTFGNVSIAPLPSGTEIPQDLGPRQPAEAGRISAAVSDGIRSWRDVGYGRAAVSGQQITARHPDAKLDVNVDLAPGPQLRFGALSVEGNENVREGRIRQIAGLPTGEVYSPAELDAAAQRLRRTGAFDSVAFTESDAIGPDNVMGITATVDESKPRRFGFGVELASIDGLTVSSFWLHRNLLGGAESLRFDGEVAGIGGETGGTDYRLGANFIRPATFGPKTEYYLTAEISRENEPDYLLDKISIENGVVRPLTDDLMLRAGIGLLTAHEETDLGARDYTLLTFPLKLTLERRDVPTNAKNGYYADVSATPFVSLIGNSNGARLYSDLRGYRTFGEAEKLTFAARAQVGSLLGATIEEAPADYLFYSGGGGTVRGQSYNSLGVETVQGGQTVTTGGTSFAGAQIEARFAVGEKISLVGFYDVGQVGDTALPFDGGDWHAGAGLGLRYDTGIGPIRLDIGTPASGDDAGQSVQVYIGIGQAF